MKIYISHRYYLHPRCVFMTKSVEKRDARSSASFEIIKYILLFELHLRQLPIGSYIHFQFHYHNIQSVFFPFLLYTMALSITEI